MKVTKLFSRLLSRSLHNSTRINCLLLSIRRFPLGWVISWSISIILARDMGTMGECISRGSQNDPRPWPVHTGLFCFLLLFFLLNGKKIILSHRKGGNYECQYVSEEIGYGDV